MEEYKTPQARALVYSGFTSLGLGIVSVFIKLTLIKFMMIGVFLICGGYLLEKMEEKGVVSQALNIIGIKNDK